MKSKCKHHGQEIVSLDDYRNRYAQYKADSQLQAAHFSRPWLVVWTTMKGQLCRRHLEKPEVSNAELLLRRQCLPGLHEHMPLR